MKQRKREDSLVVFLGVALAYFVYLAVLQELTGELSDYNGHLYTYLPLFKRGSWVEGWKMVPYCMWHLTVIGLNRLLHVPLEAAAGYTTGFFHMSAYFVMYWMIRRYTEAKGEAAGPVKASLLSLGLSVVQSLYFFWLDAGGRYVGTFSMNPLHNPTQMSVRPFVLLCFCLVCDIWGRQRDDGYRGIFFRVEEGLKKYYFYLAAALFLSSMAKPVFAEMFIPAVALIMLAEWLGRIYRKDKTAREYFQGCLRMLLCSVPTLAYILIQFLAYFIFGGSYGGDGSLVVTEWMEVWSMFSENVALSIALGMAFPLYLVLVDGGFFVKDDMGRLALAGYGTGLLEAAMLGEGGVKLGHADFIWPMICGMQLLWMAAMLRLSVLDRTGTDTEGRRVLVNIAWGLFSIHVVCGIVFFRNMILNI